MQLIRIKHVLKKDNRIVKHIKIYKVERKHGILGERIPMLNETSLYECFPNTRRDP